MENLGIKYVLIIARMTVYRLMTNFNLEPLKLVANYILKTQGIAILDGGLVLII